MEHFTQTLGRAANSLEQKLAVDLRDIYAGNNLGEAEAAPEKSGGLISPEMKIAGDVADFYGSVSPNPRLLSAMPQDFAPLGALMTNIAENMQGAMVTTVRKLKKALEMGVTNGEGFESVWRRVQEMLGKRMENYVDFLSQSTRQVNQFMVILYCMQKGHNEYMCINVDETCEKCESMNGAIFKIDDAQAGENLPSMHPHCDCVIGILDRAGDIVILIADEKYAGEYGLIDALKNRGLPFHKNAVLYPLRGDLVDGGLPTVPRVPLFLLKDMLSDAFLGLLPLPLLTPFHWYRQSAVWMKGVLGLEIADCPVSAQMLWHSLQYSKAQDVVIREREDGGSEVFGTDRIRGKDVIDMLKDAGAITEKIDKLIAAARDDSFYFSDVLTLDRNYDQKLSFYHATVTLNGKKQQDGSWVVQVHVYDIYNFAKGNFDDIDWSDKIEGAKDFGIEAAATSAWWEQEYGGSIKNYDINVYFTITIRK